jgi:predicted dehydrogenase
VSAGRKNRLGFELNGSERSAYWNQEEPEKLWIGNRDRANEVLLADAALFAPEARGAIHHPAGHNEGWPDAMKHMMRSFYGFLRDGKDPRRDRADFATFADGHRSMRITEAILESHAAGRWARVEA